jgi:hypothetical protein
VSGAQALPLLAACLWLIAANLAAMLPSRDDHRSCAAALVLVGVPLLGWATYALGPNAGVVLMAAGASMLRWPLKAALGRLRRLAQ